MIVKEIVKKYLKENGFDGLVEDNRECACEIDDLIACDDYCSTCEAGYQIPDPTGEYDWLITTKKPQTK